MIVRLLLVFIPFATWIYLLWLVLGHPDDRVALGGWIQLLTAVPFVYAIRDRLASLIFGYGLNNRRVADIADKVAEFGEPPHNRHFRFGEWMELAGVVFGVLYFVSGGAIQLLA